MGIQSIIKSSTQGFPLILNEQRDFQYSYNFGSQEYHLAYFFLLVHLKIVRIDYIEIVWFVSMLYENFAITDNKTKNSEGFE